MVDISNALRYCCMVVHQDSHSNATTPVDIPLVPSAAYAMTEASHQMTSNPLPKHGPHKPGSVGRAQGSVKVGSCCCHRDQCLYCTVAGRLVVCGLRQQLACALLVKPSSPQPADPQCMASGAQVAVLDGSNRQVPTGKIGEVCIQGPNVTKGYLNRPEANKEAYAGVQTGTTVDVESETR